MTDEDVRRKLNLQGVSGLTNAELISILLRTKKKESAIRISFDILHHFDDNLTRLGLEKVSDLRRVAGMGLPSASMIAAALELGKRLKLEEAVNIDTIRTKEDVVALFKPSLAGLPHEEFWALYLGASHRIIDRIKISQGSATATIVDNRLIIRRALDKFATSLIIVHNHPSGNPTPSAQDAELTEKLGKAAGLFDIQLTDHIIITTGESYSFRANGLL